MLAYLAVVLMALPASSPDLSGTWKLDESRSRIAPEATLTGLIGAGAPDVLHVSQTESGTLVVQSQINESHARLYQPGREISTPVFVGGIGSVTVSSRWEGANLIGEGRRELEAGASREVVEVREVFGLDAGRDRLEIEVTFTGPNGRSESFLSYGRIRDVGPCESWPTPCKKPGPRR